MSEIDKCVFLDFETRSKRSIEDGAFAYAADPSTDILCVAYSIEDQDPVSATMDQEELIEPLLKCIKEGYKIVAHNFLFEIAILKYVAKPKYGWPTPKLSQMRCTMQMAGRAGLPLSLGDAAKALNISEKLESGKALIKLFSTPDKQGRFVSLDSKPREKRQLLEYCEVDTIVSREIYQNLPEWKEIEIEDVLFDLKSNLHGVPIDVNTAQKIYEEVLNQQAGFAKRVTALTNGVITKMTQIQRIKAWAQKHVNESIPSCDAEHIIKILEGEFGEVDDVTKEILEMRQHSSKSSTGKYVRYINSHIDDHIHGMIISFGAHTGRPISKLLNLYNLPKPSIKYKSMDELVDDLQNKDAHCISEKYGSYLKSASTAIRGIITAPKEKILAVSDYAAIEARIVFWLANCVQGLKKYHEGIDLYIDVATHIFHKKYNDITDDERWVGKQVILGAGYGLGSVGFVNSCARWGVDVKLQLAQQSIEAYRETYYEVPEMWEDLESAALLACRTGKVTYACNGKIAFKTHRTKSSITMLQMKLPSGRCINYPHVRIEMVTTPWGARKKAITYRKVKDNGFYRESTYGGKIAENAVQAIARDIMYYGAKQAQANGYTILFTVYDEVISLVNQKKADIDEFNELICRKPDWAKELPLKAEGKLIRRYQKL